MQSLYKSACTNFVYIVYKVCIRRMQSLYIYVCKGRIYIYICTNFIYGYIDLKLEETYIYLYYYKN